jgi:hypothetical protein
MELLICAESPQKEGAWRSQKALYSSLLHSSKEIPEIMNLLRKKFTIYWYGGSIP